MQTITNQSQNRNINRPHGGQASLGLFGTPGFNAPRQPLPRLPKASRIKGALNSFSSDGLTPDCYRKPALAMERNELGEPAPVPVTTPAMRRASAFSEARLRSEAEARFEAAAAHRRAGAGLANRLMAMEG